MMTWRLCVPLAMCTLLSAACSSSDSDEPDTGDEEGMKEPDGPGDSLTQTERYDEKYARCDLETDFEGDDLCLVPPDPAEGFQLHYGPSDYDDPEARYLIAGAAETNEYVDMETPNEDDVYFNEYHVRIRPGTHHMILYANDDETLAAFGGRFLIGAQAALGREGGRMDVESSKTEDGKEVKEYEGLATRLNARTGINFNMHYVNTGTQAILAEAWINFHYADPDEVRDTVEAVTFYGGLDMSIAPGTEEVVQGSCHIPSSGPEELRIVGLSGHMHAHGKRFTAHKVTPGENGEEARELIYETYSWAEPENLRYNSVEEFDMPNSEAQIGGGRSGPLVVKKGERIDYECEFENHDLNKPLVFANEAYTAEMCNLFGYYTPGMGGPWVCASSSTGTVDGDQLGR